MISRYILYNAFVHACYEPSLMHYLGNITSFTFSNQYHDPSEIVNLRRFQASIYQENNFSLDL